METKTSHVILYLIFYVRFVILSKHEDKRAAFQFHFIFGLGRATRTTVHYYYREWKNGVTGDSDQASQMANLQQHISQWQELTLAVTL